MVAEGDRIARLRHICCVYHFPRPRSSLRFFSGAFVRLIYWKCNRHVVILIYILGRQDQQLGCVQHPRRRGQQVIDIGPYASVRHPMYAGAIWLFVGIPLALGSWWTVVLIVPFIPVLLWRLLDEERILRRDLPGYIEYTQNVRYRLIPHVW